MQGEPPYAGPLYLEVHFHFLKAKSWSKRQADEAYHHVYKPDLDNLIKLVKDSLNKKVWVDDAQVAVMVSSKTYGEDEGISILVRPATILDTLG